jgi:hypothetical protein
MIMAAPRRAARRERDIKQGSGGGFYPRKGRTLARPGRLVERGRPERFVIFAASGRFSLSRKVSGKALEINLSFTRELNRDV